MKKILSMIFCVILCLNVLVGCGLSEVNSRDDANRVLLSASSTIAECETVMKEYKKILDDTKMSPQNKLGQVKENFLNDVEKRLEGAYNEIISCNSYKDVEDVKPKYDSSMDKYERAVKSLELLRNQLAKLEDKK